MTQIAVENRRISNWLKWELAPEVGFGRKTVVVNEAAAKSYVSGTVLGKVTATGKYKIAVETAVDGSQVPAAIVIHEQSIAATTDTKIAVLVKMAIVGKLGIVLDATYNDDTKKATAYAALEALNINVVDQV